MHLHEARIDRLYLGVKVARLGLGVCPRQLAHWIMKDLTLDRRGLPADDDQPRRVVNGLLDPQR